MVQSFNLGRAIEVSLLYSCLIYIAHTRRNENTLSEIVSLSFSCFLAAQVDSIIYERSWLNESKVTCFMIWFHSYLLNHVFLFFLVFFLNEVPWNLAIDVSSDGAPYLFRDIEDWMKGKSLYLTVITTLIWYRFHDPLWWIYVRTLRRKRWHRVAFSILKWSRDSFWGRDQHAVFSRHWSLS